MSESIISEIKKDYIYSLATNGKREDGRALDQYRDILVDLGVVDKAEGSAYVKIGDTQVLVGVKIQPGEPFPDTPDQGIIIVNMELSPVASPVFEASPPRENAIELARVVDRGIRESKALNLSKLCIEEGVKVWTVFIDIQAICDDGNLMDASSLGAIAALLGAKLPRKRYDMGEDESLPVSDLPVAVTAVKIGEEFILDPNLNEGQVASTKVTVISNKNGDLAGMQKSGIGMLSSGDVYRVVDMARRKAKDIRKKFLE